MPGFPNITFDQSFPSGAFQFNYQWLTNSSYRIILQPSGYLFINNCTVEVTIPSPSN